MMSGCKTEHARFSNTSRKACCVTSRSPVAMGISIRSIFMGVGEKSGRVFMAGIPVVRHEARGAF
jgi:hypothetical protein